MTEELSLGETLDGHLRRYNAEQTRQVQARFDEELKTTRDAEIGNTNAKLPGRRSTNRRRKSLQDLFSSFGDDDSSSGRPSSPDGHAYLTSLHGSLDDDRNRLALREGSSGLEGLGRPAFMVPGQESSSGSLRHVEAHPAHIQAPVTQKPSSLSAMAAYYSSLNESSDTASANEPSGAKNEPAVLSPASESSTSTSSAPGQGQIDNMDRVKTDVDDQQSASPCQPGPTVPPDDSAAPGQGPRIRPPEPQQEPRPDHPKPQQRNNIVPLPFKVRDKHA